MLLHTSASIYALSCISLTFRLLIAYLSLNYHLLFLLIADEFIAYVKVSMFFTSGRNPPAIKLIKICDICICLILIIYSCYMRCITIWKELFIYLSATYYLDILTVIDFKLLQHLLNTMSYKHILSFIIQVISQYYVLSALKC